MWDVDGETLCVRGAGNMWECAVLSAQFCCESENVLKNKIYFKNIFSFCMNNGCKIVIDVRPTIFECMRQTQRYT